MTTDNYCASDLIFQPGQAGKNKSEDVHGALGVRSAVNRPAGVLGRPTDTAPGPQTATSAAQKMPRQHAGGRVKSSRRPPRNAAPWYQSASTSLRKAEPPYPSNPATLHSTPPALPDAHAAYLHFSSSFPNRPCSVGQHSCSSKQLHLDFSNTAIYVPNMIRQHSCRLLMSCRDCE
jgi:hypothetical protein